MKIFCHICHIWTVFLSCDWYNDWLNYVLLQVFYHIDDKAIRLYSGLSYAHRMLLIKSISTCKCPEKILKISFRYLLSSSICIEHISHSNCFSNPKVFDSALDNFRFSMSSSIIWLRLGSSYKWKELANISGLNDL